MKEKEPIKPPVGWPENIPLPTKEDFKDADTRIGERIEKAAQERRKKRVEWNLAHGPTPIKDIIFR